MKLRLVVILAVLSTLLAACGGDDNASDSTTTTAAAPTTNTTSQADVDRQRAQQLVLAQSDIPSGWVAKAPDAESTDEVSDQINTCIGTPPNSETRVTEVKGNDFSSGRNTINSDVTTYKTAQIVDQNFSGLTDTKSFKCVSDALNTAISNSLSGSSSSSSLTKLSGVTTSNSIQFALRLTTTITTSTQSIKVYSDLLGVKDGRYQTSITVTYFDSPPPLELDKSLLAAATRRLANVGAKA